MSCPHGQTKEGTDHFYFLFRLSQLGRSVRTGKEQNV